jgi:transposase
LGPLDLASGRRFFQLAVKAVGASFIAFLDRLLRGYPTAAVMAILLDNVQVHRSKAVRAWLAARPRVRLVHGARYSPHHTPVERVWGALKASLANSPTLAMAGRLRQVRASLPTSNTEQVLHAAAPHGSPWLPYGYGQRCYEAASVSSNKLSWAPNPSRGSPASSQRCSLVSLVVTHVPASGRSNSKQPGQSFPP